MSENTKINIIVAHDKNNGIGYYNNIPWKCKKDMIFFKYKTIGHNKNNAVIMGKNTWLSIPNKPLKDRENIVISKTLQETNLFKRFDTCNQALDFCNSKNYDEVWIIGGEKIYQEFILSNKVNYIYTTEIDDNYTCDVFFPKIPDNFKFIKSEFLCKLNEKDVSVKIYKNTLR